MSQTVKSLYLADDLYDLKSQLLSRTSIIYNEDHDQTTLLQEAFDQFEQAQMTDESDGDEELAYLRYLTYLHTLRIIKRNVMSDVQKEYYELHQERRKFAYDRTEDLLKSLKRRYGDRDMEMEKLCPEKADDDRSLSSLPTTSASSEKILREKEEVGQVQNKCQDKVSNKNNVQDESASDEVNVKLENSLLQLQNLIFEQQKKLENRLKEAASNDEDDGDCLSPEVDSSSKQHFYPLCSPNVKNVSFPSRTPPVNQPDSSYDFIMSLSVDEDDDDSQVDPVEFMPCSSSPLRKDVDTQSENISVNSFQVTQFVHYVIRRILHDERELESLAHDVGVELPGVSIVLLMETLVVEVGKMGREAEYTAAGQMVKLFIREKLIGAEEVMKILSSWMFNIICPMVDVYLHSRYFTSCLPTFLLAIFEDELNFNWLLQLAKSMDNAKFNLPILMSHNNNNNNRDKKRDDDVRMDFIRTLMNRFKRNNNDDDELLDKMWGETDESLKDPEVEQSIVFQFEVLN